CSGARGSEADSPRYWRGLVPLVPRDRSRELRKSRDCRAHQSILCGCQSGSRRTSRRRFALSGGDQLDFRPGRLAADRVSYIGWQAIFRRHLIPAGRRDGPAGVQAHPRRRGGGVSREAKRNRQFRAGARRRGAPGGNFYKRTWRIRSSAILTRGMVGLDKRQNFRTLPLSICSSILGRPRATPICCISRIGRWRRWLSAVFATSLVADFIATLSMNAGLSRTLRKCLTIIRSYSRIISTDFRSRMRPAPRMPRWRHFFAKLPKESLAGCLTHWATAGAAAFTQVKTPTFHSTT